MKSFCSRALRLGRAEGVRTWAVLLLGPPGSGKSAFCKALGAETNRPTLILDVWYLLEPLVEKALAGSSGASGDSGVSA